MKSDIILRMIEQLTQALAQISGLVKAGDAAGAQVRLDEAFSTLGGIKRELAEMLAPESLADVTLKGAAGMERGIALAKLLQQQAVLYTVTGDHDAAKRCSDSAIALVERLRQQPGAAEYLP